jgi:hypothetical protein
MSGSGAEDSACFEPSDADELVRAGWTIVSLPAGLTLSGLRGSGAPFKGSRYFDSQARDSVEFSTVATMLAYRPALMAESFNESFAEAQRQVTEMDGNLPGGAAATVASAAAYVWLLQQHVATTGRYPFAQLYTWAVDRYQDRTNLVVGVFGRQRPIVVAPITEGHGSGVGVWPVVVPRSVVDAGWPTVEIVQNG